MINEVSPPGWGHTKAEKEKTKPNKPKSKIGGTADAMKQAQKRGDIPKKMNIFALMWSMKNKGDKPHYKPGVKDKLKKKYKGPEGQNEEKKVTDQYPPTRLFKNVPNSTVKKANKEGDKAKKEAEKAVLGEPPKSGPSGETMHSKDNVYEDDELVSLVAQAINELSPENKKKREVARNTSTLGKGRRVHGGRSSAHPKGAMVSGKTHTFEKPAGAAKKPGRQKIVSKPVRKEAAGAKELEARNAAKADKKQQGGSLRHKVWPASASEEAKISEDAWRDNFKKQAAKRIGDSKRRKQAQQHSPGQRVPPKTKNYGEDIEISDAYNSILDQQRARISGRPDTPKKQKLGITPAGKKALKKGDHKLSITAKGKAAVEDMSLAPKGKGRKAAKALYKENEVTHFGDVLRQAITEAKKVNAIDTINKIVKTKTMGKLHGQKVDLFTASAIQSVYNALNKKNQQKMTSVMSKDVHGLLKMADFSMRQMKR